MKTLIKSLVLALTLGVITTAASFATPTNGNPTNPIGRPSTVSSYKTGIYSTVTGKLQISLDKTIGGRVDIRLMDTNGKILYAHYLGKHEQGCRVRLNLSDLEDGVYTLEITNGVETTQSVTISTQRPAIASRVVAIN
jgi:hypothetical protein